eukprot:COSAG02_NODE_18453_length_937_cov_1.354415_1_plen_36_part_10
MSAQIETSLPARMACTMVALSALSFTVGTQAAGRRV